MGENGKLLILLVAVALAAIGMWAVFSDESLPSFLADAVHNRTETVAEGENENGNNNSVENDESNKDSDVETRAVWVTYSEIGAMVKDKTQEDYERAVDEMTEKLKSFSINTVYWHVRAFGDSLYLKTSMPISRYVFSSDGTAPQYDMFEIFLEKAHEAGIAVYAWINPFRLGNDSKSLFGKTAEFVKNGAHCLGGVNGLWLDVSDAETQDFVLDGISEVLDGYDVDGIHFDDYFYPEGASEAPSGAYDVYKNSGGTMSLSEWRVSSLSAFISSVHAFVKSKNGTQRFGVSPCGKLEDNLKKSLADVKTWCECGYLDFVVPQLYYGLENETAPFEKTAEEWAKLCKNTGVELVGGLAAYKCGSLDKFAGTGSEEWVVNSDILSKEYGILAKNGEFKGFSLFSYSYCFDENLNEISKTEIKNLVSVLK